MATAMKAPLDLCTATQEELLTLDGVGEQRALAIMEYREKNDGFGSVEELKNIPSLAPVWRQLLMSGAVCTGKNTADSAAASAVQLEEDMNVLESKFNELKREYQRNVSRKEQLEVSQQLNDTFERLGKVLDERQHRNELAGVGQGVSWGKPQVFSMHESDVEENQQHGCMSNTHAYDMASAYRSKQVDGEFNHVKLPLRPDAHRMRDVQMADAPPAVYVKQSPVRSDLVPAFGAPIASRTRMRSWDQLPRAGEEVDVLAGNVFPEYDGNDLNYERIESNFPGPAFYSTQDYGRVHARRTGYERGAGVEIPDWPKNIGPQRGFPTRSGPQEEHVNPEGSNWSIGRRVVPPSQRGSIQVANRGNSR